MNTTSTTTFGRARSTAAHLLLFFGICLACGSAYAQNGDRVYVVRDIEKVDLANIVRSATWLVQWYIDPDALARIVPVYAYDRNACEGVLGVLSKQYDIRALLDVVRVSLAAKQKGKSLSTEGHGSKGLQTLGSMFTKPLNAMSGVKDPHRTSLSKDSLKAGSPPKNFSTAASRPKYPLQLDVALVSRDDPSNTWIAAFDVEEVVDFCKKSVAQGERAEFIATSHPVPGYAVARHFALDESDIVGSSGVQ